MADTAALKKVILALLREQTRDLWEVEDTAFLEQLAEDVAREKVLAVSGPHPEEHLKNLEFLAATLQGEVARRNLKLNKIGREVLVKVLVAVIKTVALPAVGIVL